MLQQHNFESSCCCQKGIPQWIVDTDRRRNQEDEQTATYFFFTTKMKKLQLSFLLLGGNTAIWLGKEELHWWPKILRQLIVEIGIYFSYQKWLFLPFYNLQSSSIQMCFQKWVIQSLKIYNQFMHPVLLVIWKTFSVKCKHWS